MSSRHPCTPTSPSSRPSAATAGATSSTARPRATSDPSWRPRRAARSRPCTKWSRSARSIRRRSSRPGCSCSASCRSNAPRPAAPASRPIEGDAAMNASTAPTLPHWTREQMAARVARDIGDGAVVNLGIGLPTLVANHLPAGREVVLHSENGVIGMGPAPAPGEEDYDLINAGKQPVTLLPGGAFFHHADSFAMMRGGHLDICVLGAFQVSHHGDLANWHTGAAGAIPAVGGAMDLAIGAKKTFVMMEHLTKAGESKLVAACTYPLTGLSCVSRVYTDLAVIDVGPAGATVVDIVPGLGFEALQAVTGVPLRRA